LTDSAQTIVDKNGLIIHWRFLKTVIGHQARYFTTMNGYR